MHAITLNKVNYSIDGRDILTQVTQQIKIGERKKKLKSAQKMLDKKSMLYIVRIVRKRQIHAMPR